MQDNYYAVIMAGGGGTRLWPLSRAAQPKQMLQLIDDQSLFQIAVRRLVGEFPADRILIVTIAEQTDSLREQAPNIPFENFIIEPMPRGTASVIGLAGIVLQERNPEAVMAVLTADHFIGNEKKFLQSRTLCSPPKGLQSDGGICSFRTNVLFTSRIFYSTKLCLFLLDLGPSFVDSALLIIPTNERSHT